MSEIPPHRRTASWKRIRAGIGPHAMNLDPDEHADLVWDMTHRRKWDLEEELNAELADTKEADRRRSGGEKHRYQKTGGR